MKHLSSYRYSLPLLVVCCLWLTLPWGSRAQIEIKPGTKKTPPVAPKPAPAATPKPEPKKTAAPKPSVSKSPTSSRSTVPDIEMVLVQGGSFLMGSPANEQGRYDNEGPQHRVTVPSFYMGKYEVTQAQWRAVMGTNPSDFKGDDLPVEKVSWNDAKAFCRKLSQLTGKQYRLPTEAEWEYAARAGTTGPYAGELAVMAFNSAARGGKEGRVGQNSNAWGLYDMHGNVWEWCEDTWHKNYEGAPTDGLAWLSGGDSSRRVLRGGWGLPGGSFCRSAYRNLHSPGNRNLNFGFRVVVGSRTS